MSTTINITVGDSRLLNASKRRTAANQQALNDRTETAKQAAAAEEAAQEVAPPERPSGVPSNLLERRPAAQRRKKEKFELYAVDFFPENSLARGRSIPNSRQISNIQWPAFQTLGGFSSGFSLTTKTWTNAYDVEDLSWLALFYKDLSNRQVLYSEKYDKHLSINSLGWTFAQGSAPVLPAGRVYSSPPRLPFNFADTCVINNTQAALVSCTSDTIYVSTMLRVNTPDVGTLTTAGTGFTLDNPQAFELRNPDLTTPSGLGFTYTAGSAFTEHVVGRSVIFKDDLNPYTLLDSNVMAESSWGDSFSSFNLLFRPNLSYVKCENVGLYWKYNFKENKGELKIKSLSSFNITYEYFVFGGSFTSMRPTVSREDNLVIPRLNYLNNLDPLDPNYVLWKAGESSGVLNPVIAVLTTGLWKWPSNTTYNPETGVVIAITIGTKKTAYTKNVGKNLSPVAVKQFLPPIPTSTVTPDGAVSIGPDSYSEVSQTFYESNGWQKLPEETLNNLKDADYNFLVLQ